MDEISGIMEDGSGDIDTGMREELSIHQKGSHLKSPQRSVIIIFISMDGWMDGWGDKADDGPLPQSASCQNDGYAHNHCDQFGKFTLGTQMWREVLTWRATLTDKPARLIQVSWAATMVLVAVVSIMALLRPLSCTASTLDPIAMITPDKHNGSF